MYSKRKRLTKTKAFTLIELLVVVAIIGILAAVGVVAYNGYTKGAKKNSAKAVHATIVKYVSAELTKCNFQEKIFEGTYDCADRSTPTNQAKSIPFVLGKLWGQGTSNPKFKHPNGTYSAYSGRTPGYYSRVTCNSMWEYNTLMEHTATEVKVYTCPSDVASDKMTTIIPIE